MNYLCKWEIIDIIFGQSWISTRKIGIPPQYRGITGIVSRKQEIFGGRDRLFQGG
jgi:hypothetical protein